MSEMIVHDDRDTIIAGLRQQLREAREELAQERAKGGQVERGALALRTVLTPLYGALQHIFGETDAMGLSGPPADTHSPQKSAVWEDWKSRLGGMAAKAIDALLLHRELNTDQLMIHLRTSRRQTAHDTVFKLNQAGIINKRDGKISLKEL